MSIMHTETVFASAKVTKLTQMTLDTCDAYDANYHWGGISIYPADPLATDIYYPGLPVGVHLPPGIPIHLDLLVTPAPPHLVHTPLVCPGAPRPDTKPKGPKPQPVKPAPKELKETDHLSPKPVPAPKAESAQAPKSASKSTEPAKDHKSDSKPLDPIKDPESNPKPGQTLPGVYGTKRRLPGSRPYFIYAFPYDGERWTHLPQSRRPIECKSKDVKAKSIEKMDIETCMFNDPISLGTCIPRPKTKKKAPANDMASVFAAAAKKEKAEVDPDVSAILGGMFGSEGMSSSRSSSASISSSDDDHEEKEPSRNRGSDSEWSGEEEEPMSEDEDNPPAPSDSPPTCTKPPLVQPKYFPATIHEGLDSDTELIDLDLEPAIRQLQFPTPRRPQSRVYHAPTLASSRPSYFGSHLHNALANFRARYGGSLSSLSSSSGGSRLSMESKGPSTPPLGRDDAYVHVPKREERWCDDEVNMGNGAIPMQVLRLGCDGLG